MNFKDRVGIALKDGGWLTWQRVLSASGILLALEIAAFIFFGAGTHGWIVPAFAGRTAMDKKMKTHSG